jgi:hypothetical protein
MQKSPSHPQRTKPWTENQKAKGQHARPLVVIWLACRKKPGNLTNLIDRKRNSISFRGQISSWLKNWCSLTVKEIKNLNSKHVRGPFYHGGQNSSPLTTQVF